MGKRYLYLRNKQKKDREFLFMRKFLLSNVLLLFMASVLHSVEIRTTPITSITNSNDKQIEVTTSYWETTNTGVAVIRMTIFNRSQRNRDVTVTFSSYSDTFYTKTIRVPAGKTVRQIICPPYAADFNYCTLNVSFSGKSDNQQVATFNHNKLNNYSPRNYENTLIYKLENVSVLDGWTAQEMKGVFIIRITEDYWKKISETNRRLLLNWVVGGGVLQVEGRPEFSSELREKYPPELNFSNSGTDYYGAGIITSKEAFDDNDVPGYLPTMTLFSECLGLPVGNKENVSWSMAPLRPDIFIPILIIIGFLIGPAIFLWCRWKKYPGMALVLIPAVSIIACISLLIFALFSEGVRPKISTRSITFLDQNAAQYRTYAFFGIEAPLGLFEPLEFSEDSLVYLYGKENLLATVRDGKINLSSMVRPRIPIFLSVSQEGTGRRERINVSETGDGVVVTNGLGSDLTSFVLCDKQGRYWKANSTVKAGEDLPLTLISKKPAPLYSGMNQIYYGDNKLFYTRGELDESTWQAELANNVFAELSIKKYVEKNESTHFVIGKY